MAGTDPPQSFTTLDWIGTLLTSFSALGLLLFSPLWGEQFSLMFRDFGADSRLPPLTRLALSWWFPMIFGLLVAAGIALGIRRAEPIGRRRAWVAGAFVVGAVGFAVCLTGLYLPIFALAGAVKAD